MKTLVRFVLTNGHDVWFQMYDTAEEAIAVWSKQPFVTAVERWEYDELPDGTHNTALKQIIQARLPTPAPPAATCEVCGDRLQEDDSRTCRFCNQCRPNDSAETEGAVTA